MVFHLELQNITLPPKQKKRVPKGDEKTVIGLPAAKKLHQQDHCHF